jgi:hypothetical protein
MGAYGVGYGVQNHPAEMPMKWAFLERYFAIWR